jgi:hypothetical protein
MTGELLLAVEFERQGAVVFKNDRVLCKAWEVKGLPTANV